MCYSILHNSHRKLASLIKHKKNVPVGDVAWRECILIEISETQRIFANCAETTNTKASSNLEPSDVLLSGQLLGDLGRYFENLENSLKL